jgi:hypothetical protein
VVFGATFLWEALAGAAGAERTGSTVVRTRASGEALVRAEEAVETAASGPLPEPVAGSASGSWSLGSESDWIVLHSGGKSPSVSDAVMLGVQGSVRIGGGTGLCFQLLLIGVNPESTGDCLEGVSGISSGIVLTVLRDDLRPEELRCFLCLRDDLCFLLFRWDLLLLLVLSSSCSLWRFFRLW